MDWAHSFQSLASTTGCENLLVQIEVRIFTYPGVVDPRPCPDSIKMHGPIARNFERLISRNTLIALVGS